MRITTCRVLLATALVAALFMAGCSAGGTDEATDVAVSFVTAALTNDADGMAATLPDEFVDEAGDERLEQLCSRFARMTEVDEYERDGEPVRVFEIDAGDGTPQRFEIRFSAEEVRRGVIEVMADTYAGSGTESVETLIITVARIGREWRVVEYDAPGMAVTFAQEGRSAREIVKRFDEAVGEDPAGDDSSEDAPADGTGNAAGDGSGSGSGDGSDGGSAPALSPDELDEGGLPAGHPDIAAPDTSE